MKSSLKLVTLNVSTVPSIVVEKCTTLTMCCPGRSGGRGGGGGTGGGDGADKTTSVAGDTVGAPTSGWPTSLEICVVAAAVVSWPA